jgi:glucose/arabinose dehydrogenase
MRQAIPFLLFIFLVSRHHHNVKAQILADSTLLDSSTIAHHLDVPWEIKWGHHDNHLWITERYGRVSRINPANGNQDVVLDLSGTVYQQGESGLLGMVLHPNFVSNPQVFFVYTYLDGSIKERLVRYDYNGTALVNPFTLIEGIPGNTTHDGSRLLLLADNTLLMSTGDAQNQAAAQDLNSLNGKMLRFNLDGSIPTDNPIPGSALWTWGHRNAQGLLLAPNGRIYSSEHGPTTDDEINLIEKGRNYGWPDVHGFCDSPNENQFCLDSNVVEPLLNWTPTIAVSDIEWYGHPSIPEFTQHILMTVLKDKKIVRLTLNVDGTAITGQKDYFSGIWGRLRDICVAPDGTIYLATNGADWSNTDPFTHTIVALKNSNHPVGIYTNETGNRMQTWPNPANNQLYVQVPEHYLDGHLEFYDTTGKQWLKHPITTTNIRINTALLPGGIVYLVAKKEKAVLRTKVAIYR